MALRLAAIALFFITLALAFFGQHPDNTSSKVSALQNDINKILNHDSVIVWKYFGSDNDKKILTDLNVSPLYIEVFRNDSIIYWNDNTEMSKEPEAGLEEIALWGDSVNYALVSLNLNDLKTQQSALKDWKIYKNEGNNYEHTVRFAEKKFNVAYTGNDYIKSLIKNIAWLALFTLIILCWIILKNKIISLPQTDTKSGTGYFVLLWILTGGWTVLHYFPVFYQYFGITSNISGINIYKMISGLWVFIMILYFIKTQNWLGRWFGGRSMLAVWMIGFYIYFVFGISIQVIENWILETNVNLEIESLLQFDFMSFLVIASLLLLMFIIFHSSQLLFEWMHRQAVRGYIKTVLIVSGWLGAYIVLRLLGWVHVPVLIFLIFIAAYCLIMDAYSEKREKKITYLIWWMMMFSGFLAVTLFYFGLKKDILERTTFMNTYFKDFKPEIVSKLEKLNENLLKGEVFTTLATRDPNTLLDFKDLNDFIRTHSDSTINVTTELFNKRSGTTLFSNHFSDYYKLNQSYIHARRVGKNIFHHPFENCYYSRFEIAGSEPGSESWYLFIINHDIDSLSDQRKNREFGYVVYHRDQILEKKENGQAGPSLSIVNKATENKLINGYSLVVSTPSDQYRIVTWKKISGLIKPISLFSFLFTIIGLMIIIFTWINTKYDFLPENLGVKFGARSSLKTKIQFSIILLIVVTFIIIGIITAIYFRNLIIANQKTKQVQETESIVNNINNIIQNYDDNAYGQNFINSKLKDLSYIHNKEMSLYDDTGKLIGSTNDVNNHLRIPYSVWSGDYVNQPEDHEYIPLYIGENRVTRTKPFAFVDINHQSYNSSINILDFLSTILNAYIFLFLIAGAIAITIANSITQPLSILAEKLKKFKLGKTNELLEWNSNDEIGALIHDYNNLTLEVEKSAGLLAKTERDMAWREMAKQVAHEIKNPLTPMKLNIQYLEKTAKDYPDRAHEMIPRVSSVLIEQIDNLSQIANEFSNFAAMPQATNEKVILNEVVETIHDLFRKRDDMDINMIEPIDDLYVFADKNHLVRILNNLLKNAIQAIPEDRRGKVEIELSRKGSDALIRVSDNGTGIPDHMKSKVFTPNFTTKSSGTGLGLAISANMIDSCNGKIYFETIPGKGTDFYISIPLMRTDEQVKDDNRVNLDE